MAKVAGTCDARFQELETIFQRFLDSGEELGASIVVNVGGNNVVDIWGGYIDEQKTRPWEENTIVNVWSSSKTVLSLAALLLVERGQLDLFEKVSKYWPEFAENGKQDVEVRHFLSHASGVSGFQETISVEDIYDLEKIAATLAKQAPWWTPGTQSGYHSLTMGVLIGELIHRVSGKPVKQFIAEELAGPLGADFQLGVTEKDLPRVSPVVPPPPPTDTSVIPPNLSDPSSVAFKTLLNPAMDARVANTSPWQQASVAAANGHTNARGIARLLSTISLGGTAQDPALNILSPATIDLIFHEQVRGPDLVMSAVIQWGIGYALSRPGTALSYTPDGRICMWGGWGGSMVVCDVDRGVTIAYMMNKMANAGLASGRAVEYIKSVYRGLGVNVKREGEVVGVRP